MKTTGANLVLLTVAQDLGDTFTAEELVVAAWQKNKMIFGLKGFEGLYPNANRVLASLMGVKGLVKRGYFKQVAPKTYSLAAKNVPAGESLQVKDTSLEKDFLHYLESNAHFKIANGEFPSLIEALHFWAVASTDNKEVISNKLNAVEACLSRLEVLLGEQKDVIFSNGLSLTERNVQSVRRVHKLLQEKFSRHLRLLYERTISSAKRSS